MKISRGWIVAGTVLAVLVVLIVWSYANPSLKVARGSEEWSRGQRLGQTPVQRSPSVQPIPEGGVYLVWTNLNDEAELAQIDRTGEVVRTQVLPIGRGNVRDPQLQVGPDGRLHVLWREEEQPKHTVNYAMLEADGTLVGESQVLSDPNVQVFLDDIPRMIGGPDGRLHALWADEVGIHWAAIDSDGTVSQGPMLVAPEGRSPAVQIDAVGQLHLAWRERADANTFDVYYAVLDSVSGELLQSRPVAQAFTRVGQTFEEMSLGIEMGVGYVFWTVQDMRDVANLSKYVAFPLDFSQEPAGGTLPLAQGINPAGLHPLNDQQTPLLVAFSETVGGYMDAETQVAIMSMSRGRMQGREELVTGSGSASLQPSLVMDDVSNLHLAWLETAGFRIYDVVYGSNSAGVMAVYNALTLQDGIDIVLENGVQFLSMSVLTVIPMLFLWAVVPMVGLVVYHVLSGEERLELWHSWLVLALMILFEVALVFGFPPAQESAWPALRWMAPLVSSSLGALAALLVVRRPGESKLFMAFFLFTGVNGLIQMILYYLFA